MDDCKWGTNQVKTGALKPSPHFSRGTGIDLGVIVLLWGLAITRVNPIGNFPLNDDWSWSLTAKRLAAGEGYHPTGWTEMTLFTHALWGALFCLPQGFSFTALRISTLVLSLIGILAMYGLLRQLERPRPLALIGALALAFNPIYFALSNTYMADVPFTAVALLSVWCLVRHLQRESQLDLFLGTALAVIATLSRQMGLFLPLAFGGALWLKHGLTKDRVMRMVLPYVICLATLLAFQYWLKVSGKTPANTLRTERLWAVLADPTRIPINLAYYGWSMLLYLGWFLLPLTLFAGLKRRNPEKPVSPSLLVRVVLLTFVMVSGARFVFRPALMPVHNNIIAPQGIGPATLYDVFDLHLPHLPTLPVFFWLLITVLSLGGAALLLVILCQAGAECFQHRRFNPRNGVGPVGWFFLLGTAIYLLPFILSGFFDRYLVPVTALLIAFVALCCEWHKLRFPRSQSLLAGGLIGIAGVFSIVGTRDYLEWNRTRWKALNALLTQTGVTSSEVNGGFEFNGWYHYNNSGGTNQSQNVNYLITFGEVEGFEPAATYTYQQWLPPREGRIFVLKRHTTN